MPKKGSLTDDQVRFIRNSKLPLADLSDRFGVSKPAISRIRNRTMYVEVPDEVPKK